MNCSIKYGYIVSTNHIIEIRARYGLTFFRLGSIRFRIDYVRADSCYKKALRKKTEIAQFNPKPPSMVTNLQPSTSLGNMRSLLQVYWTTSKTHGRSGSKAN